MSFLQRIFRRPDYQSDVTQFIEQLQAQPREVMERAGFWSDLAAQDPVADLAGEAEGARP